MENEKNKYTIIVVIVALLVITLTIVGIIFAIKRDRNDNDTSISLKINQLYSSDYTLNAIGDEYFIGTYEENKLSVIIDKNGHEIYKPVSDISYDNFYKMKDDRYLIYCNRNGRLITYVFDGKDLKEFFVIEDVSYVNPIIYKGISNEYIVGFASLVDDDLYLYNLTNGGIIVVNKTSLVGDFNNNGTYYTNNENYLVVKNTDGLMGVIDLEGKVIIDCKYKNIINSYNDSFVALNNKDKYGIIDKNDEVLLKFKYKAIDYYDNYYIVVNTSNKMALYDLNYKNLTGFSMAYDPLILYDLRSDNNSINLYKIDGKVLVLNNYLEDKNGTEYEKHDLYIINDGKIVKTIKQVGFSNENVVYTYDKKYNVSIYDNQFELLFEFKIDDVKRINSIIYVSSEIIKVDYLSIDEKNVTLYYNLNGEKVDFSLGKKVIDTPEYFGYLKKTDDLYKLSIYSYKNELLDEISGKNIKVCGDYLIIDNCIYKIELMEN